MGHGGLESGQRPPIHILTESLNGDGLMLNSILVLDTRVVKTGSLLQAYVKKL